MVMSESERQAHSEDVIEYAGGFFLRAGIVLGAIMLILHLFGVIDMEQWNFPIR